MASTEDKDKKTKDSDKSKKSEVDKDVNPEEELSEIEVLQKNMRITMMLCLEQQQR